MRLAGTGYGAQRVELAPRHRRQAAIHLAITATGTEVGNATPVAPDRTPPQFGRRGLRRIGKRGRYRGTQAIGAQTGGEQMVIVAVIAGAPAIHPTRERTLFAFRSHTPPVGEKG